jgi:hypothetical protein
MEQLLDLLRGQNGCWLVHDEHICSSVEHLEDLDPLLLADRELPDTSLWIDAQPEPFAELGYPLMIPRKRQVETRLGEAEKDVLGDSL